MENKNFLEIIKKMNASETTPLVAQNLFKSIQSNQNEQPGSVKNLFKNIEDGNLEQDIFSDAYEIKGNKFLFTKKPAGTESYVFFLVQDTNNPKKWKSRGFNFSNSDHQYKLIAGNRKSGSVMKGEESNPLHHYVQSGKIDKEIYKVLDNIQKGEHGQTLSGLDNNLPGDFMGEIQFQDEFELKENFLELKNPEWNKFQKWCQGFYHGDYRNLVQVPFVSPKNKTLEKPDGSYFRFDEYLDQNPPIDFRIKSFLEKKRNIVNEGNSEGVDVKELTKKWRQWQSDYPEVVGNYIREQFQKPMPDSMMPDFAVSKMIDQYKKWDKESEDKKNHINVGEYKVESPQGDELIFAMAYNEAGQVYIDNIYDPRVGINDYGIYAKIVNMGHLVYKPEDYSDQTAGISKEDKKTVDRDYEDITALWQNIPIIKKYKEELKKRGILK